MFTGIYQSITILIIVLAFYAMDFLIIHHFEQTRRANEMKTGRAWDFTIMVFAMVIILVLQPTLLPQIGLRTSAWWGLLIQCAGILLAGFSLALHIWARFHLKHFYAERVEITEHHQVIDTGPYAIVRHPIIVSFFGLATSLLLVIPSLTTLALVIYTFWDFSHAAAAEEKLLSESLPDYASYMKRTPRFFPRIITKHD